MSLEAAISNRKARVSVSFAIIRANLDEIRAMLSKGEPFTAIFLALKQEKKLPCSYATFLNKARLLLAENKPQESIKEGE